MTVPIISEVEYKNTMKPCTERFVKAAYCFGYIIAIIGIFQYFFGVLHTLDALEIIEEFLRTNHNWKVQLDWGWLAIVGWMTVLGQLYILGLTFSTLIDKNYEWTRITYWNDSNGAMYAIILDSMFAIFYGLVAIIFYVLCTVYNYKLLSKVLEFGPPVGLEILKNHTSFPVEQLMDWTFQIFMNRTGPYFLA